MLRPNLTSLIDLLVGLLLLGTASPVPEWFAGMHAYFLITKGIIFQFQLPNMSAFTPLLLLGGAADIMSAAILLIGTPPILADYAVYLAAFLFLKGFISLISFL